jgi:hypothetical protein
MASNGGSHFPRSIFDCIGIFNVSAAVLRRNATAGINSRDLSIYIVTPTDEPSDLSDEPSSPPPFLIRQAE